MPYMVTYLYSVSYMTIKLISEKVQGENTSFSLSVSGGILFQYYNSWRTETIATTCLNLQNQILVFCQ